MENIKKLQGLKEIEAMFDYDIKALLKKAFDNKKKGIAIFKEDTSTTYTKPSLKMDL